MSELESIQESLDHVSALLDDYAGADIEDFSPEWFSLQSLINRQAELFEAREVAAGDLELSVSVSGAPVLGGTIAAKFLGETVAALQDTVSAIVQAIIGDTGSKRSTIVWRSDTAGDSSSWWSQGSNQSTRARSSYGSAAEISAVTDLTASLKVNRRTISSFFEW
jgi:hypothetical protein